MTCSILLTKCKKIYVFFFAESNDISEEVKGIHRIGRDCFGGRIKQTLKKTCKTANSGDLAKRQVAVFSVSKKFLQLCDQQGSFVVY